MPDPITTHDERRIRAELAERDARIAKAIAACDEMISQLVSGPELDDVHAIRRALTEPAAPVTVEDNVIEKAVDLIATVRDNHPRLPDDASSEEIAVALVNAGLLRPFDADTHPVVDCDKPEFVGREVKTLPHNFVNAIVRDFTDPRYPAAITVYCDRCHVEQPGTYIVTDDIPGPQRLGFARAHMRTLGWACGEHGDFCPDCQHHVMNRKPLTGN